MRSRFMSVIGIALCALTAAPAAEVVVKNDSLVDGGTVNVQAGFVANERAAAWLTSPCNGNIVAVQIFWRSVGGSTPPSLEHSITIHGDGTFPVPGPVLAFLEAPLLTDGFMNEFRYLDENNTVPILVPINQGQRFVVSFQFANTPGLGGASICTDTDGCQAQKNGLFAIPPGAWFNSCSLGVSGDFVIRAVVDCEPANGACCLPDGSCAFISQTQCNLNGGIFQGDNVTCGQVNCPQPTVACCFESTGGCLNLTAANCLGAGGIPGPAGSVCATYICFPEGACCLPDGDCLDAVSPETCAAQGGTFQGDQSTCASVNCPLPTGACCFSSGFCLELTEGDCLLAGAAWAGAGTTCADGNGNGTADDCEPGTCPGDVDGDGFVDLADLSELLTAFQTCDGDAVYNPDADFDGSGCVDLGDLSDLLTNFGGPCP